MEEVESLDGRPGVNEKKRQRVVKVKREAKVKIKFGV